MMLSALYSFSYEAAPKRPLSAAVPPVGRINARAGRTEAVRPLSGYREARSIHGSIL
jgi:hypothetical protein